MSKARPEAVPRAVAMAAHNLDALVIPQTTQAIPALFQRRVHLRDDGVGESTSRGCRQSPFPPDSTATGRHSA